jgi:hypothetical protein
MRLLTGADDGINRAGRKAFDATDAALFIDHRNQCGSFNTIVRVERQRWAMEQMR